MTEQQQVDESLKKFLEWEEKNRREGKTIEALHDKQDRMHRALLRAVRDRLEDKEKLQRHGRAIKTLQHQVGLLTEATDRVPDWRAPKEETTGVHNVREIAKATEELEERLDREDERKVNEETWWRRQRWVWLGIAVATVCGTLLTGCVAYMSIKLQAIERVVNEKPR